MWGFYECKTPFARKTYLSGSDFRNSSNKSIPSCTSPSSQKAGSVRKKSHLPKSPASAALSHLAGYVEGPHFLPGPVAAQCAIRA